MTQGGRGGGKGKKGKTNHYIIIFITANPYRGGEKGGNFSEMNSRRKGRGGGRGKKSKGKSYF